MGNGKMFYGSPYGPCRSKSPEQYLVSSRIQTDEEIAAEKIRDQYRRKEKELKLLKRLENKKRKYLRKINKDIKTKSINCNISNPKNEQKSNFPPNTIMREQLQSLYNKMVS
ncbi:hypothetical protein [Polycladidibacter stylochi]|uniref:hypothetical protein n=1 Tax=Polycladidibacter stylochi TaxID=1807766 RepID=UPI00082A691D|nr:hypothetical protein [Pseudovibrio stylochi]